MTDHDELDDIARRSAAAVRKMATDVADTERALGRVGTNRHRSRLLRPILAAVIVAAVAAGVVALRLDTTPRVATNDTAFREPDNSIPTSTAEPTTVSTAESPPTATNVPTTAPVVPPTNTGCDTTLPSTSIPDWGLDTFHTMAPGPATIEYTLGATPAAACPGGTIDITITIRNTGAEPVTVTPRVVITSVYPHISLATASPITVQAHSDASIVQPVVVPLLPAGRYPVNVYGSLTDIEITILAPQSAEPTSTTQLATSSTTVAAEGCEESTLPRAGDSTDPTEFGTPLAATVLSCHPANQARSPVVDGSTLWLTGTSTDGVESSPVLAHLDSSLQTIATIPVPAQPIAIALDGTTMWVIASDFGGAPTHLFRIDTTSGEMLSDEPLDGFSLSDGAWPPASIATSGADVWVSIGTAPNVRRYHSDGTLAASIELPSPPVALTAVAGHLYALTTAGTIIAIDAPTDSTSVLATLAPSLNGTTGCITAFGNDLWADTSELVHIDLSTNTVTARRPAYINSLVADPYRPGRAWAAPFEPDPTYLPGDGNAVVVELAERGVDPDQYTTFETIAMQGIAALAIADNGTVYGQNLYTSELVRITPA